MAKTPKTTTAPTGSIAPFGLRMLPDLRERIEDAARANGRSMNAEITARLAASFESKFLSDLDMSAIEDGAKVLGYTPGTDQFKSVVDTITKDVHERAQNEASESIKAMLRFVFFQRENPEAFERLVDSGIEAGVVDPKFRGQNLVPKKLKDAP